MSSISSSCSCSVWRVLLLAESNNTPVIIEFSSPTTYPLYIDEKKLNSKTKKVDKYPIQIKRIDNQPVLENAMSAVARTEQLECGGTVLLAIEYAGKTYLPEDGIYYWFPPLSFSSKEKTLQKKPIDGLIQIQLQNTTEIDSIYASPLHSIPFMDLTGAFRYEYIAISYTKKTRETQTACNIIKTKMHITLIEIDDRFTEMLDNATGIRYSIERTFVFRQIQVNKTRKNNIKHSI
jgi:hypothetical protein